MAKIIRTHETSPDDYSEMEREWVYNGLDTCVTLDVFRACHPQLDEHTSRTYDFSRALQGPALEMRLRGLRVDMARRAEVVDEFHEQIEILEAQLERIVFEGVGMATFSWRSNKDLQTLFYDILQIPPITRGGRPTCNRDALEKLHVYLIARQIVNHIITMREIQKKIDVLRTELDPDGRMRTSYNIAGTNTGRFSSSYSDYGTGGNLQNIEESLRSTFIADEGYKFGKFDGAQIQSRIVGGIEWNLFGDGRYLDACESGDLHTTVAKMAWPDFAWTGDMKKDRKLAELPYYRHYDRRFMCKKLGHGTNFDGRPDTLATQAKIPVANVAEFQRQYHAAFPSHREWRDWTDVQLQRHGYIIALDGRKRHFWGRRGDSDMIRDALAYDAQSTEAYIMNTGMLNIWRARDAVLMMHDHDALTVMYKEELEDEVIPKIAEQLRVPIQLENGRVLEVPMEAKVGWNRGDYDYDNPNKNPDGLKLYVGHDDRKRTPAIPILQRMFYGNKR